MRRIFIIVLIFFLAMICFLPGECGGIKLFIDSKRVTLDTDPIIKRATVFVPLRGVFEVFKAQVSYDKTKQTVKAIRGKNTVVLVIDQTKAKVNGIEKIMPIPAFIHRNRTMVPLRFISESLGCNVRWEPGTSSIYIDSKGEDRAGKKEPKDDINVDDFDVDFK